MPRPSRSILRKRASEHESLSHWQICRPAIAAGMHRDEVDQRPRRDDHPAGVLRDVARQAGDLARQLAERVPARAGMRARDAVELLADALGVPAVGDAREPLELAEREAERLADVADRAAAAVGGEARDERCVLAAVALGDRDDQLLADLAREVEVDVGDAGHLVVQEAAEREVRLDRVDVREAGEVADERADARAAAAAGRQRVARASRGRAPRARTRGRARAPPSGGGRSRRGRAARSARAPRRGAAGRRACGRSRSA